MIFGLGTDQKVADAFGAPLADLVRKCCKLSIGFLSEVVNHPKTSPIVALDTRVEYIDLVDASGWPDLGRLREPRAQQERWSGFGVRQREPRSPDSLN